MKKIITIASLYALHNRIVPKATAFDRDVVSFIKRFVDFEIQVHLSPNYGPYVDELIEEFIYDRRNVSDPDVILEIVNTLRTKIKTLWCGDLASLDGSIEVGIENGYVVAYEEDVIEFVEPVEPEERPCNIPLNAPKGTKEIVHDGVYLALKPGCYFWYDDVEPGRVVFGDHEYDVDYGMYISDELLNLTPVKSSVIARLHNLSPGLTSALTISASMSKSKDILHGIKHVSEEGADDDNSQSPGFIDGYSSKVLSKSK